MGRLISVLLHLLVGNIQHRLQLVLDRDMKDTAEAFMDHTDTPAQAYTHTHTHMYKYCTYKRKEKIFILCIKQKPCPPSKCVFRPLGPVGSCLVHTVDLISPEGKTY